MAITEKQREETLWAGPSGERWLRSADQLEAMIQPIGDALIERAAFAPVDVVVDIGCGAGATTLQIARLLRGVGHATGLDISPALIDTARRRADQAQIHNAKFVLGDASVTTPPAGGIDVLFSRFGVMFFSEPFAAFHHLRTFLRPGGRTVFACWAAFEQNPWMGALRDAVSALSQMPPRIPRAPGPFAFEEADYVKSILETSGFKQVQLELWKTELFVGGSGNTAPAAAAFALKAMSFAQFLREAPPATRQLALDAVTRRMQDYTTPLGVKMPAAVWIVTASA